MYKGKKEAQDAHEAIRPTMYRVHAGVDREISER